MIISHSCTTRAASSPLIRLPVLQWRSTIAAATPTQSLMISCSKERCVWYERIMFGYVPRRQVIYRRDNNSGSPASSVVVDSVHQLAARSPTLLRDRVRSTITILETFRSTDLHTRHSTSRSLQSVARTLMSNLWSSTATKNLRYAIAFAP